jgi:hypothetical protein
MMPADGMSAATKNKDFGTSRWQLADYLNVSVRTEYMGSEAVGRGARPIPYNLQPA